MENKHILLGIGVLTATVCMGTLLYVKNIKKKIKGFTLQRKRIEKYLKET